MNSRATSLAPDTQEWSRGEQVPAPQAAQNKSMEFARNAPSADFMLNQQTKVFISSLYDAFNTGNVPELKRLYCFAWDQQTNAYYKDCPWPSEEAIAELCDGSQLFQLLYKEHCFRHLYAIKRSNGKPYAGVLERVAAFEHYCRLFDFIIDYGNDFPYTLPLEWLFDLISEFVYQFQSYWQYHAKIEKMSEEDIANFQEHAEAWHPSMVIYYLDELQKRSMIKEEMIAKKTGAPAPPVPGQVLHMLGYLAMIGEARLQLVLGDYNACLDAISTIDISSDAKGTGLFTRVPLCRVYLYYCAGFSYMMLKRFPEASRVLNLISVSLERSHTNHG
jgi:translation initiation factor 3 subunit L